MLAQREHDYFAETVICANCYIVATIFFFAQKNFCARDYFRLRQKENGFAVEWPCIFPCMVWKVYMVFALRANES